MTERIPRVLPTTDGPSGFFWRSGADGRLRFLQCSACRYRIHPPTSVCPRCLGRDTRECEVSGRGRVHTFTVNHQPWDGDAEPYVIAVVSIDEQPDLRLTTNLVGIEPDDVHIDMTVEVVFEEHENVFLPLFGPAGR